MRGLSVDGLKAHLQQRLLQDTMTEEDVNKYTGKSSLALHASFILRKEITDALAIMLTYYPFHIQLQNFIKVIELKKALQLRGLSVTGLKTELQQRLRETIDNTATTTHDKDEDGVNVENTIMQQKLPGLPYVSNIAGELPTKTTTDKDEKGINKSNDDISGSSSSKTSSSSSSDNESSNSKKLTGLPSVCNIDAALLTNKTNYKNVEEKSKTSSSSSSDTESSNSNNGILADDNTVSTTNFPI